MLERIWKKILRRQKFSLLALPAFILWIFSFIYRFLFFLSKKFSTSPTKLPVPVISIGNISVGGTGKTPIVEFLASALLDEGFQVGIVSSGYGRRSQKPVIATGLELQGKEYPTRDIGDEIKQLAGKLPQAIFSIDKSKTEAAKNLADGHKLDLIIIDDGFQHAKLHRDIDILTFDASIDNEMLKLFPYGILREPISSLQRADKIIITRSNLKRETESLTSYLKSYNEQAQYYKAAFINSEIVSNERTLSKKYLQDKSVFLFAGIGNFKALEKQVSAIVSRLDFALELSDHQDYNLDLLNKIKKMAQDKNSDLILTTAKDWVKLSDFDFGREIYYLDLSIDLDPGEEKLVAEIKDQLNLNKAIE
jgi:tetraacyldisaccharide 4'-kinase